MVTTLANLNTFLSYTLSEERDCTREERTEREKKGGRGGEVVRSGGNTRYILPCHRETWHTCPLTWTTLSAISILGEMALKTPSYTSPVCICTSTTHPCMYMGTCAWVYVCMSVCTYECTYVWVYVRMSVCMYECMYVWLYVCMSVCMYECMYVWVYVHMSVCRYECVIVFLVGNCWYAKHLFCV